MPAVWTHCPRMATKSISSNQIRGAHAAPSQAESVEAEFLRVPAAAKFSGLSRSHLYELVKSGEIKSACIRRRGALRGIRLIHRDSLTAFILKNTAA